MTDLHTQARDEADRLRAAGDDGAADLVDALRKENERLRDCLFSTRDEICYGPVDDTLWHTVTPSCTTVDNICLALGDDWDYDDWLALNALTPHGAVTPETKGN